MEISHAVQDNVMIITPQGKNLNATISEAFKKRVLELIRTVGYSSIILDLHLVESVDSTGIGSFLTILRAVNHRGGDLRIAGMSKEVRALFELLSMHKILEVFNTTEDAVKSFRSKSSHDQAAHT